VDFYTEVSIVRRVDEFQVLGFTAEIRIQCTGCAERFQFMGLPVGLLAHRPSSSPDGTELRVPIRPPSAGETFGLNLPGSSVDVCLPRSAPGTYDEGHDPA
jgi:hypothetical protein